MHEAMCLDLRIPRHWFHCTSFLVGALRSGDLSSSLSSSIHLFGGKIPELIRLAGNLSLNRLIGDFR